MPIVLAGLATLGASVGGSVASYCHDHPGINGCVNKRDLSSAAGMHGVPQMLGGRGDGMGPCNVPQYNFDQCHNQAVVVKITSSIPAEGQARFENIPPACMDLASALVGNCDGGGPRPVPCGTSCLLYEGLTQDDFATLSNALNPPH
ncbi:hypothetical protein F4778DRAFT_797807 [Xylariomycetidae sp. FL2044]|nr:hypothetical protein F4778DRAFT_797807 [Xylariomycetidae sp. FL2044]